MTLATAALALALFTWPGSAATAPDAPTADAPMLLDFHAEWCGPCRQMRPVVARLQAKRYPVKSIDVDEHRDLAQKYRITGVPTFVVVDATGRELARSSGAQAASDLAGLYNDAVNKLADRIASEVESPSAVPSRLASAGSEVVESESGSDARTASRSEAPLPWETAVRIKVGDRTRGGPIGFGSGTIIYSTPDETIILTCAHIFQIEGARKQLAPSQFRVPIEVDLFDGILHGKHPKFLHPVESLAGQAIDYDFKTDVGLIRIRPGRILASSPVVPASWKPSPGLRMTTVGCSEGQNASPWTTIITNPTFQGRIDGRDYRAIECQHAPKQGRSGGGLYTLEGYVAGVCNFAEPSGGHGLYATPSSIHRLLDRNQLTVCYNPADGNGAMLASASRSAPARRSGGGTTVRAQNAELAAAIPMPDPDRLGVGLPPLDGEAGSGGSTRAANRPVTSAGTWQAPAGTERRRMSTSEALALLNDDSGASDGGPFVEPADSSRRAGPALTVLTPITPTADEDDGGGEAAADDGGSNSDPAVSPARPSVGGWRAVGRGSR